MLICKKRGRREERTVLLLLLFNTVSEDYVIILKCTIYRDVFHSWKSLYASLWKVTILFTWYNITLCFCTVTDVRANVLFFFFVWQKKSFIFSTVFCNFAVSNLEKERKWGSKKKKHWKAVRPYVTNSIVCTLTFWSTLRLICLCCLRLSSLTITFQRIGSNKCFN